MSLDDAGREYSHLFALPVEWEKESKSAVSYTSLFSELSLDVKQQQDIEAAQLAGEPNDLFRFQDPAASFGIEDLQLPDLSANSDLESSHDGASLVDAVGGLAIDGSDFWRHDLDLPTLRQENKVHTWATFADPGSAPSHGYQLLSEMGDLAWDAALYELEQAETLKKSTVVRKEPLLKALIQLSTGVPSVIFPFHETTSRFYNNFPDMRLTGASLSISEPAFEKVMTFTNLVVELRTFQGSTFTSPIPRAGLSALASVVKTTLDTIESSIAKAESGIGSLLQFLAILERPSRLVTFLTDIVAESQHKTSNGHTTKIMCEAASRGDLASESEILRTAILRVSRPWLDELETLAGLGSDGSGLESMPDNDASVLSPATTLLVSEMQTSLHFLQQHVPEHLLCRQARLRPAMPLQLAFGWADIARIESKASDYHRSFLDAIAGSRMDMDDEGRAAKASTEDFNATTPWDIPASLEFPMALGMEIKSSGDDLSNAVANFLDEKKPGNTTDVSSMSMDPELATAIELSLTPMLQKQHALLALESMRTLLVGNELSRHLKVLHDFYLGGSGVFASRLGHVLFAADADPTEKQAGTLPSGRVGAMGLRLGSGHGRAWPPTSAELSLALMGVLEAAQPAHAKEAAFFLQHGDGQARQALSFALRDNLDPEHIEKVLDPMSVHAVDFLRLSYTPPPALGVILDSRFFAGLDVIFTLVLRLLRLQSTLSQLNRDISDFVRSQGFAQKALRRRLAVCQHRVTQFFTSVTVFFLRIGIFKPWSALMADVAQLEHAVVFGHGVSTTVQRLAGVHAECVKTMLAKLLLRKRQRPAAEALTQCLQQILDFATRFHALGHSRDYGTADSVVADQMERFEQRLQRFIAALEACKDEELAELASTLL